SAFDRHYKNIGIRTVKARESDLPAVRRDAGKLIMAGTECELPASRAPLARSGSHPQVGLFHLPYIRELSLSGHREIWSCLQTRKHDFGWSRGLSDTRNRKLPKLLHPAAMEVIDEFCVRGPAWRGNGDVTLDNL